MTGERQVPFFCPYCGDEALRPSGPQAGDWHCSACLRGFQLRFTSVGAATGPAGANSPGAVQAAAGQPRTDPDGSSPMAGSGQR